MDTTATSLQIRTLLKELSTTICLICEKRAQCDNSLNKAMQECPIRPLITKLMEITLK